jgi:hypothetical protein
MLPSWYLDLPLTFGISSAGTALSCFGKSQTTFIKSYATAEASEGCHQLPLLSPPGLKR